MAGTWNRSLNDSLAMEGREFEGERAQVDVLDDLSLELSASVRVVGVPTHHHPHPPRPALSSPASLNGGGGHHDHDHDHATPAHNTRNNTRRYDASDLVQSFSLLSPASADSERRSFMGPNSRLRQTTDPGVGVGRANGGGLLSSKASFASDASAGKASTFSGAAQLPVNAEAEEFKDFMLSCLKVEHHLTAFTNDVQRLGSVMHLVLASRGLHKALTALREYLGEHAHSLGILLDRIKTSKSAKQQRKKRRREEKKRMGVGAGRQTASSVSDAGADSVVYAFVGLADSVRTFNRSISDFEDYNNEEAVRVLEEFETELRILAGALEYFSTDGEHEELRRFVTVRASALKKNLEALLEVLRRFQDVGIPCITFSQKRSTRMILNASTIATFFAGVAATTLQYSVLWPTMNSTMVAVNTLWFSSMVLAIGAAMTGTLAMTWRAAAFSSPKHQLPWFIRFWIRGGYLTLLIASVITFLAGMVAFAFDAMPNTSGWVITAFTAFCALGLLSVAVLFAKQRYSFSQLRHDIKKEIGWGRFYESSQDGWAYYLRFHLFEKLRQRRRVLTDRFMRPEEDWMPTTRVGGFGFATRRILRRVFGSELEQHEDAGPSEAVDTNVVKPKRPAPWSRSSKALASSRGNTTIRSPTDAVGQPKSLDASEHDLSAASRYKGYVEQLGCSISAAQLPRVVHLSFSPDGLWLAICFKYECYLYDVSKRFDDCVLLKHNTRNALQVEWAPSSRRLISRTKTFVKVWELDDDGNVSAPRKGFTFHSNDLTDVQWLNDNVFLVIADERSIYSVDISQEIVLKRRYFPDSEDLKLYYLYTVPNSPLLFIVADWAIEGLSEKRAVDCLIVFEMQESIGEDQSFISQSSLSSTSSEQYQKGTIRRRIPLLHAPQSLSFGHVAGNDGPIRMVIGYEDKPPEVWAMDISHENYVRLKLERELVKKAVPGEKQVEDTDWGEASLVGPSETIVACVEENEMFFWDIGDPSAREHFHNVQVSEEEVDELPHISWASHTSNRTRPMFVSAGKSFPVRVWEPMKGGNEGVDAAVSGKVQILGELGECNEEMNSQRAKPESMPRAEPSSYERPSLSDPSPLLAEPICADGREGSILETGSYCTSPKVSEKDMD